MPRGRTKRSISGNRCDVDLDRLVPLAKNVLMPRVPSSRRFPPLRWSNGGKVRRRAAVSGSLREPSPAAAILVRAIRPSGPVSVM